MNKFLFIGLLSLFLCADHSGYLESDQECKTNFECLSTGCCKDHKCVDSSECGKFPKKCYKICLIASLVILLLIIVYYCVVVCQTRENVKRIQDQNSARAREQNEQIEKLKKNEKQE